MPTRIVSSRFWKPAAWGYAALVLIGMAILAFSVKSFANEQRHSDELGRRTAQLASEVCKSEKLLRGVVVGIALNQPSLDNRLVLILEQTLRQLPETCPGGPDVP